MFKVKINNSQSANDLFKKAVLTQDLSILRQAMHQGANIFAALPEARNNKSCYVLATLVRLKFVYSTLDCHNYFTDHFAFHAGALVLLHSYEFNKITTLPGNSTIGTPPPYEILKAMIEYCCYESILIGNAEIIQSLVKANWISLDPDNFINFCRDGKINFSILNEKKIFACLDRLAAKHLILPREAEEMKAEVKLHTSRPANEITDFSKVQTSNTQVSLSNLISEIKYQLDDLQDPRDNNAGTDAMETDTSFLEKFLNPENHSRSVLRLLYNAGLVDLLKLLAAHKSTPDTLKLHCNILLTNFENIPSTTRKEINGFNVGFTLLGNAIERQFTQLVENQESNAAVLKSSIDALTLAMHDLSSALNKQSKNEKEKISKTPTTSTFGIFDGQQSTPTYRG